MSMTAGERQQRIDQYERGAIRLHDALNVVPDEAVKWRPAPGKWSAHEVVCHCADSETNAAARIRFILCEENPLVLGYDQARWAKLLDYHSLPLEPALAAVEAVRAHTVFLLRRVAPEGWERTGRHTESGSYSAERWLEIYAEHLEKHARQIDRNLEAWRAEDTQPG